MEFSVVEHLKSRPGKAGPKSVDGHYARQVFYWEKETLYFLYTGCFYNLMVYSRGQYGKSNKYTYTHTF